MHARNKHAKKKVPNAASTPPDPKRSARRSFCFRGRGGVTLSFHFGPPQPSNVADAVAAATAAGIVYETATGNRTEWVSGGSGVLVLKQDPPTDPNKGEA